MDIKVVLPPCALFRTTQTSPKLSNSCSGNRNWVSPDLTVEQCELFSLPKSYHCIQVEETGTWPLVSKYKISASFLMAVPTQQRPGGSRRAAEKGQDET